MFDIDTINDGLKSPRYGYINCIRMIFTVDEVSIYDIKELFMHYLEYIEIMIEGRNVFAANGLTLMAIDNLYTENRINDNSISIKLNSFSINPWICVRVKVKITDKLNYLSLPANLGFIIEYSNNDTNKYLYDNMIPIYTYDCERIDLPAWRTYQYKHKLHCQSYIKYFLIYLSNGINVIDITLSFCDITCTYSYLEMNKLLPHIKFHINELPKNLLLIPFINDTDLGINLNRVDNVTMTFTFSKNSGGYIYVMSEAIGIFDKSSSLVSFDYSKSMDTYISELVPRNKYKCVDGNIIIEISI